MCYDEVSDYQLAQNAATRHIDIEQKWCLGLVGGLQINGEALIGDGHV